MLRSGSRVASGACRRGTLFLVELEAPGCRRLSSETGSSSSTRDKVLVLGGSGFVGSSVCRALLDLAPPHTQVVSLSRSGLTPGLEKLGSLPGGEWVHKVTWSAGDVFHPEKWGEDLKSTSAVVSCVGAFGSKEHMLRVNGEANVLAAMAASDSGVERFVFISAHDFGLIGRIIPPGYYQGKRSAESAILEYFPRSGFILYPGMIHGPRIVGTSTLPLQLVGAPLQMVFSSLPWLERIPVLGPAMVPPVPVSAVGRAAAKCALGLEESIQKLSVKDILQIGR